MQTYDLFEFLVNFFLPLCTGAHTVSKFWAISDK